FAGGLNNRRQNPNQFIDGLQFPCDVQIDEPRLLQQPQPIPRFSRLPWKRRTSSLENPFDFVRHWPPQRWHQCWCHFAAVASKGHIPCATEARGRVEQRPMQKKNSVPGRCSGPWRTFTQLKTRNS